MRKKTIKKTAAKSKISQHGGMEKYASKAAMVKHEKTESKKVAKKEDAMFAKKTASKKSPAKKAMKMPMMYGN